MDHSTCNEISQLIRVLPSVNCSPPRAKKGHSYGRRSMKYKWGNELVTLAERERGKKDKNIYI